MCTLRAFALFLRARGKSFARILLVDDHEIVREGMCTILSSRQDLEICGEGVAGQEAVEKANALKPHLIILDITMPRLNGFQAVLEIRKFLPIVPILFLTMHDSSQMVQASKNAGEQGYVTKAEAGQILLDAVDALLRGQTFFPAAGSFKIN